MQQEVLPLQRGEPHLLLQSIGVLGPLLAGLDVHAASLPLLVPEQGGGFLVVLHEVESWLLPAVREFREVLQHGGALLILIILTVFLLRQLHWNEQLLFLVLESDRERAPRLRKQC